jgi:hypothetical protein
VAYSDLVVDGRDVAYTIQISSADLYEAVGVDRDRPVTRDEARAGRAHLFDYIAAHVHIETGGAECQPIPGDLTFIDKLDGFFAAAHLTYRCPRAVEQATVRYDLFFDLDPRHQGIARVAFGDEEGREQLFRDDARTIELRRDLGVWDHVRDYLHLGVEHIFTGYDHIAFLFGLLVIAGAAGLRGGAKKVIGVVSAFTLAHSVTLIGSALGWFTLPSKIVEPAIAASIAYVGIENLVNPKPRFRWALTFIFGLIHGFGFASVLKEIGLPQKGLLLSLVSFNVGVEIGQLVVVAAVLPLLALIAARSRPPWIGLGSAASACCVFLLFRNFGVPPVPLSIVAYGGAALLVVAGYKLGYDRAVRIGGSSLITALAIFWFFERVLGANWFGGRLG